MKPSGGFKGLSLDHARDVKQLCRRHGLNYVETADLGLRRRRYGKGFGYVDAEGVTVRNKALKARKRSSPYRQPRPTFASPRMIVPIFKQWGATPKGACNMLIRTGKKLALKPRRSDSRLGSALPRLRGAVRKALSAPELTRTKVIAAVVRLIDRALLRPGL